MSIALLIDAAEFLERRERGMLMRNNDRGKKEREIYPSFIHTHPIADNLGIY